jgi:hypothetical protein
MPLLCALRLLIRSLLDLTISGNSLNNSTKSIYSDLHYIGRKHIGSILSGVQPFPCEGRASAKVSAVSI